MPLLGRYVARRFVTVWAPMLAFFILVAGGYVLARVVDLAVQVQAGPLEALRYAACQLPWAILIASPMATVLAVALAFGRLVDDREVAAAAAAGIGPTALWWPSLLLVAFHTVVLALAAQTTVPRAHGTTAQLLSDLRALRSAASATPVGFQQLRSGLFLTSSDSGGGGAFLEDPTIVLARGEGAPLFLDARRLVAGAEGWALEDGLATFGWRETRDSSQVSREAREAEVWGTMVPGDSMGFSRLSLPPLLGSRQPAAPRRPTERDLVWHELNAASRQHRARGDPELLHIFDAELHFRFTLALGTLVVALFALPLTPVPRSDGSAALVARGLAACTLYYVAMSIGWVWARQGGVPAAVLAWGLPATFVAAFGARCLCSSALCGSGRGA